ncbi:MAG: four helix bundle protein [Anaerolineae bacterium]|nr:four helix bundle protein [Anaerolineae bacterium]
MAKPQGRGFEDLDCYQLALLVLKEAYKVANHLPAVERYNLADQMRRASVSVTLNIAEGYGRYHYLDKLRFFYIARGSLDETLSGFIDCQALGYTNEAKLTGQRDLCHRALQALSGYIRFVHRQRQGHKEFGDRVLQEPRAEYIIRPTPEPPNPESTNPEFTNPE